MDSVFQATGNNNDPYDKRDSEVDIAQLHLGERVALNNTFSLEKDLDMNVSIYSQGSIGSCTCNAVAAAYQYEIQRQLNKGVLPQADKQTLLSFRPSRLFLYYFGRAPDEMEELSDWQKRHELLRDDTGTNIRFVFKIIARMGVCPEDQTFVDQAYTGQNAHNGSWPYDGRKVEHSKTLPDDSWAIEPPYDDCVVNASKHISLGYSRVTPDDDVDKHDWTAWKRCLVAGHAIVFGFEFYESFRNESEYQQDVPPQPPASWSGYEGGHAVLAVGWDDNKEYTWKGKDGTVTKETGCLKVQNSWGSAWADNGYFWMPKRWVSFKIEKEPEKPKESEKEEDPEKPKGSKKPKEAGPLITDVWLLMESNDVKQKSA